MQGQKPDNWVNENDIDLMLLSLWSEHCLECSVPFCYRNCELYVERDDKKCCKTFYGTKRVKNFAQLKFRKWGKLLTSIYPGGMSVKASGIMNTLNYYSERFIKILSDSISWLSPKYRLCGAQVVFRDKLLKRIGHKFQPDVFLLQCYSDSEREFNLIIEFFTKGTTSFRGSINIHRGYNQAVFDVSNLDLQHAIAIIYPENDLEAEIIFLRSDFVKLKQKIIHSEKSEKIKCVAWDLDNTIWDGTLIESENPDNLKLKPGVLETIKALDERGIIQIIASKNDIDNVLPQLKRLGIDNYFVFMAVNWNAKSENLKQAAKFLNININTFAFIDDSAYERGEVHENLPSVRVYNEHDVKSLLSLPDFDVPVTYDSRQRRIMYQAESKRRTLQENFHGTDKEFLRNCKMIMTIENISQMTLARSFELLQRTNQFNLSGHKYNYHEFEEICAHNKNSAFVIKCKDKFGSYGQTGFFIVNQENKKLIITEYVMSCRVAGKMIEGALLEWLARKFVCRKIIFRGIDTGKNARLFKTFQDFGMINNSASTETLQLEILTENVKTQDVITIEDLIAPLLPLS